MWINLKNQQADGKMPVHFPSLLKTILLLTGLTGGALLLAVAAGLSIGSTGFVGFAGFTSVNLGTLLFSGEEVDPVVQAIIWEIRLPRVILAAATGATLALGGLVFQALLRNSLAEPYILGISGGSAVGAISGIIIGLSFFPGVTLLAMAGGMATMVLILGLGEGSKTPGKDTLLLGGVMMNAFCGALIMLLLSLADDSLLRQVLFWLMGDLSRIERGQLPLLLLLVPSMVIILLLARPMNLMLLGRDAAAAMGIRVRAVSLTLLLLTSFMVALVVSLAGTIGFVGLVVPHVFRLMMGPDHRLLIPACLLGGGAYLIFCDLIARTLPTGGEIPVGVVTALIGAPLFIFLLWKARA